MKNKVENFQYFYGYSNIVTVISNLIPLASSPDLEVYSRSGDKRDHMHEANVNRPKYYIGTGSSIIFKSKLTKFVTFNRKLHYPNLQWLYQI